MISCRVRLARNLAGYPFPHQMSQETGGEVVRLMQDVIADPGTREQLGPLFYVPLEELSPLDRQILVEKHLISPQHAGDERPNRGLILRPDEAVSILVNEEDHLRIQVLYPALQLQAAWDLANQVDDTLDAKLDYAFDEQYGYLSCCPTNVGTGLRASVMMHLPALAMSGQAQGSVHRPVQTGFCRTGAVW